MQAINQEDSGDEAPAKSCGKRTVFVNVLFCQLGLGLLLLLVFSLKANRGTVSAAECLGYDECPRYPEPYPLGTWPSSYEYSGTFRDDFIWGVGTASYQVEGAYREDGRGATIWDTFTGADTVGMPGAKCSYCCTQAPCPMNKIMRAKGATGNVACDHYHNVEADATLMRSMGLKHYRFSLAWSRIFPTGRKKDGINRKGVAFYNRLIDALLAAGITPYVTLYHWDLPQGLLDPPEVLGWWSRDNETGEPTAQILPDFLDYADACFDAFGDRVKTWITFNEPWSFTMLGSGWGKAPSLPELSNMPLDPYIAAHNVLNAHAAAVDLYRRKYQASQKGKIGITNNQDWREPKTDDPADMAASARALEFQLGFFADPIFSGTGDYPPAMRRLFGERLPNFTDSQKRQLNGSADFFGLNHYGTTWVSYTPNEPGGETTYSADSSEGLAQGQSVWLHGAAWGLRKLLNWIDRRYGHPVIIITESGWSVAADTAEDGAADRSRVAYYANYTAEMHKAIAEDGVDVRGYFAWSFLDNFEWEQGYVERFGTIFNDYAVGFDENAPTNKHQQPTRGKQTRTRKTSSCWLEAVWTSNSLVDPNSASFEGCVTPAVFFANFTDPAHPGCVRTITPHSDGAGGAIVGVGGGAGCNSRVPVAVSGGTIVADFSGTGGPSHLAGYWSRANQTIEWTDGSSWALFGGRRQKTDPVAGAAPRQDRHNVA